MAKQLKVTQTRSAIGMLLNQKLTIRALGIRKMGGTVVHTSTPSIRGMIERVKHLVTVEEIKGE